MSRYSYRRRTVKIKSSLIGRTADLGNPLSGQWLAGVASPLAGESLRDMVGDTLCNQFGQSAWKAAFARGKTMPARAVIRRNSGDTRLFKMDNSHRFPSVACAHVPQRHRFVLGVILSGRASINNPFPARLHKFRRRPSMLPSRVLASPRLRRSSRTHGPPPAAPRLWT